ncbi:MAG: cob(I)yrinic acid a,c-diamide adenosyltransferase [Patescibacteria group bacterium]|nr:cob(I)yrinic acid a,c-diamide adenosyltransferase [Patescibacteria group bacterium]
MKDISTKKGDEGMTDLANGHRVCKDALQLEVIGSLDELNAFLGLVRVKLENDFEDSYQFLKHIQNGLFVIGAEIAGFSKPKIKQSFLEKIEEKGKILQQEMEKEWHQKFVLPGGTDIAANLDLARTVCRRAERKMVALHHQEPLRPLLIKVINRFSDYLYILRCYVNFKASYEEDEFNPQLLKK